MAVDESSHLASSAIDELYRRHGSEVYRYAFAVVGNHADAEDVTQTTFLNAYRALEQGVRPRKPSNWLLAIASNAIKQRFRQEQARPRYVELDDRTTGAEVDEPEGPSVGELLAALSKIPPQQRQAIVLREFEGRSYAEIAEILGVTTSALETLLFRARRSLAEELEHQLTCTDAQHAVSRATDGRLGRKERRRLREHLAECPDCSHFARVQQRHRRALKGLALLPVPLSLHFLKGIEGAASAATVPAGVSAAAVAGGGIGVGAGAGIGGAGGAGAGTLGGGLLAGGVAAKAAAVVAAAAVAGGVVVAAGSHSKAPTSHGTKTGQVAPRGVYVPGNGVAVGKAHAPGQTRRSEAQARHRKRAAAAQSVKHGKSATAHANSSSHRASRVTHSPAAHATKSHKTTQTKTQTNPPARTRTRAKQPVEKTNQPAQPAAQPQSHSDAPKKTDAATATGDQTSSSSSATTDATASTDTHGGGQSNGQANGSNKP